MYLTKLEPNNTPFEKHLIWVPLVGAPENGQLEIHVFLVYKNQAKTARFFLNPQLANIPGPASNAQHEIVVPNLSFWCRWWATLNMAQGEFLTADEKRADTIIF